MMPIGPPLDVLVRLAADHIWQSTLVALSGAVLCMLLHRHGARLRHAIYFGSSIKFLIPFAVLSAIGSTAPWPAPVMRDPPAVVTTVWSFGEPFAQTAAERSSAARAVPTSDHVRIPLLETIVLIVWLAGSAIAAARRIAGHRRARSGLRRSRPLVHGREAEALVRIAGAAPVMSLRSSTGRDAPCVVGIVRPVLVWPEGISNDLSNDQIDAIVRHELSHVRRRDNLASACHAFVEIVFWFHPMVWWLGARMVAERERACDESVLAAGVEPAEYAHAILTVCERSIDSAVLGTASIAGSVLARRMEAIMSPTVPRSPGWFLKLGLAAASVTLILGPLAAGAKGAQGTAAGRVSGVVTDQMGRVVPGAAVTVSGSAGGRSQTAETDQFGRYAIDGLLSGSHELRVTQPGFNPHSDVLTVTSGAQLIADVRLRVGTVSESITLIAEGDGGRDNSAAAETALRQQVAERPGDVDAHLALAELLYKEERFVESANAMNGAAALWAARPKPQAAATQSTGAGGDIKAPKLVRRVNPIYPEAARSAGATGIVVLEALITEEGIVQEIEVLRGEPTLNEAAIGAVRQWIYEPTRLNGEPVAVIMTTTIRFSSN